MRNRFAVVAVAAGILAFAGAKWAVEGGMRAFPQSEGSAAREFDEYAANDEMMQTFAETHPAEWADFRAEVIGAMRDQSLTVDDIGTRGHDFMRRFMLQKTGALASAPDASIVSMIHADGALLRHLQATDVALCATQAMQGLGPDVRLSADGMQLMTASASQRLRSARAGEDAPVSRPSPTNADGSALSQAILASGLPRSQVDGLFDGSVAESSAEVQCNTSVALYDGLDELPSEQAARLYASMIVGAAIQAAL